MLDPLDKLDIILCYNAQGSASTASSCSSSHSMNVIFWVEGEIIVYNQIDLGNIKPS